MVHEAHPAAKLFSLKQPKSIMSAETKAEKSQSAVTPPQTTTIRVDARIAPGTTGLLLELTINNSIKAIRVDRAVVINNGGLEQWSPDAAISTWVRYEGDEGFSDFPVTLPGVMRDDEESNPEDSGGAGGQSAVQKDKKST